MSDAPTWEEQNLADGRYHVLRQLGTGGMGLVYLAHDRHLDCEVVIKTPRPEVFTGTAIARFTREIRSLVQLTHPHIVKILDVGEQEKLPFVVLQYLEGGSLRGRQKVDPDDRPEPMPLETLCDWLEPIAEALDFIHEQGYVHRDIKPDNILFDPHGHAYLADFGVAKLLGVDERGNAATSVTQTGALVGTPYYMAPEIVQGQKFDGRADQYALAVTVHELLAGSLPFDASFRAAILMAHTSAIPPLLSEVEPTVPEVVALVVMQALAKDPAERYPDCRTFAQALLDALSQSGVTRLRIPLPGWWFARPECDAHANWWEVCKTPATVTLTGGEVYWLLAGKSVTDYQIGALARSGRLSSLHALDLNEARITDAALSRLRAFPRLRSLQLGQCKAITDSGLASLATLIQLRKLFLSECTAITDQGMESVGKLTSLRLLDLSGTCVANAGLEHLRSLERLKGLYLVGLEEIYDDGLASVAHMPQLRKLLLGNCKRISDRGLSNLDRLERLQFLGLDGTSISDEGLMSLVGRGHLRGIDVRRCPGVTAKGVAAFRTAQPTCRVSGP